MRAVSDGETAVDKSFSMRTVVAIFETCTAVGFRVSAAHQTEFATFFTSSAISPGFLFSDHLAVGLSVQILRPSGRSILVVQVSG
jgi:hypothetical protein